MGYGKPHWMAIWVSLGAAGLCLFLPYLVKSMPDWVAWSGLGLSGLVMLYGLSPLLERFPSVSLPWGRVPLHKAAYTALEKTRGTIYGMWVMETERTPEDRLNWFAIQLLGSKMPLYGSEPPLKGRVKLETGHCDITDGGTLLRNKRGIVVGENLEIDRKAMNSAINNMIVNGGKALGR